MKVLKRLLIAVVAILVIVIVIGLLLPRTRHVERSVEIDAPACVVFSQVNGFHNFNDWSPFMAVMPDASYAFEGPDFGVGSKITWDVPGPKPEVGSQTIVASTPYERVDVELDLGPQGAGPVGLPAARGRWRNAPDLDLRHRLRARYSGAILGPLPRPPTRPRSTRRASPISNGSPRASKVDWSDIEIGIAVVPSTTIAYATGSSGHDPTEISAALAATYGRVLGFVSTNGLQLAGQPLAITNYWDDRGWGFDAGIPVSGTPARGVGPDSPVRMGETYGGRVVRAVHVGAYTDIENTFEKVDGLHRRPQARTERPALGGVRHRPRQRAGKRARHRDLLSRQVAREPSFLKNCGTQNRKRQQTKGRG